MITLEDLPLADLAAWLEMNPPRLPYNALVSTPTATGLVKIFDVVVGRGQAGDPAAPAATIDSNTILGGNIPQTYRHLALCLSGRDDFAAASASINARFNNDSGANYDYQYLRGGAAATAAGESIANTFAYLCDVSASTAPAGATGQMWSMFLNYTGTTFYKMVTTTGGFKTANASGGVWTLTSTGWWRNTAAITRIAIVPSVGNFVAGTRATLYGLL